MRGVHWLVVVACVVIGPGAVRAEPLAGMTEPSVRRGVDGLGPDAQLVGGIGFGFERKLDNFFLARARLGALYASAPWIVNLGLTAEVGALAGLGWGGELEVSRGGTFFGNVGVAHVDQARWLAHVSVGFTIFGLEWQHVFDGPKPHNALLLEVRLPLGLWWLHKRQEKAEARATAPPAPTVRPRIAMPRGPTTTPSRTLSAPKGAGVADAESGRGGRSSAAGVGGSVAGSGEREPRDSAGSAAAGGKDGLPSAANAPGRDADGGEGGLPAAAGLAGSAAAGGQEGSPTAAGGKGRGPTAADVAARDADVAVRLAEARAARDQGDRLGEAFALSRAYQLRPDPVVALQLVEAELALGKPRSAQADWQRVGDVEQLPAAERERANKLRQKLSAALAHVRLELTGAVSGDEAVWIDGVAEPIATQGYDVSLDPGPHTLQLRRGDRVLSERAFDVQAGALMRLSIELPR